MNNRVITDGWTLRILGEQGSWKKADRLEAAVPGSVYGTLLEQERIPDPYWRDNELEVLKLMDNDFEYSTSFQVSEEERKSDALLLTFDGIDTLADIYLNGEQLGSTNNMHRSYEFDITAAILAEKPEKEHELKVYLHSPARYIAEEQEKLYTGGSNECMEGFPKLRKAHCMFGWDWGPRLPDAGIYRPVRLLAVNKARLEEVRVIQRHDFKEKTVLLDFDLTVEQFDRAEANEEAIEIEGALLDTIHGVKIEITVTAPDGQVFQQNEDGTMLIRKPELWWPNGYGKQPLYTVCAKLSDANDRLLDVWERRIGLRTMTVNTEADEWGNRFAHEVNGVCIFAMGADYIPEDNLFSRITRARTERLLRAAVEANHNCIRIWGGGYYPDDYFYDLCDELGLLVWQDFMFACASYELTPEFDANIRAEIKEQVRRLRHHACLGLWCGNNEMETQTLDGCWKPSKKQIADYTKLYEYIIPSIVAEEDPDAFYWPSSPSSGGSFDNPWDENRGDTHYWDVWHGGKPFTEYRKFYFRYLSEFGFQSFPSMKTIESFTEPADRNVFSRVMEMHQRNVAANGKILNYLSATYLYPKDFDQFVYCSQLLQADAIRYGVEHFRRNRGRCMGAVVWQLNDIWPVASWASIDYYGRWKALHYAERRMFAPVMISCEEHGEIDGRPFCIKQRTKPLETSIQLNVANETMQPVTGIVHWTLRDASGVVLCGRQVQGSEEITVPALSSCWCERIWFHGLDELASYVSYEFEVEGQVVSEGTVLFTAPKHFRFLDPKLSLTLEGDEITVYAEHFAKGVAIECDGEDIVLSDNYFDMNPGRKTVKILERDPFFTDSCLAEKLHVRSVYQISK